MEFKKKTIIWEDNNEPPKNYIWVKSDGNAYEFNHTTRQWEKIMSSNGSGNSSDDSDGEISLAAKAINSFILPTVPQPVGVYRKTQNKYHTIYDAESYFSHGPTIDATRIDNWEEDNLETLSKPALLYPSGTTLQIGMLLTPFYIDSEYPTVAGEIVFADEYILENSLFEAVEVTLNGQNYTAVIEKQ